jgi:hypothetical protein
MESRTHDLRLNKCQLNEFATNFTAQAFTSGFKALYYDGIKSVASSTAFKGQSIF